MEEKKKRKGRPRKGDAKSIQCKFRMTPEENDKLEFLCSELGVSKSDILRVALNSQYKRYISLD